MKKKKITSPYKNIQEKKDLWNFLFVLLFAAIFFIEMSMLQHYSIRISFFEIVILSLALFRMTRLFVYDAVGQFFRDWFLQISYTESGEVVREKYTYGFKKSVSDILGCPWCTSVWIALVMIPLFFMFRMEVLVFSLIMAVSGVATFFVFVTHLVRAKIDTEELKNKK